MLSAIAGEVAFKGARAEEKPVHTMLQHLANHNGQDPTVMTNGWLAFGQVRLDNPGSAEKAPGPLVDEDHEVAVVFDGRLLNRDELCTELAGEYRFRTGSDAEIILAAYQRWGTDFVQHLHGHFAIVLADQRRHRVILCRDRLGAKPLYLARTNGRLRFAPTLPALVASGGIDTTVDKNALHHYMSWHSIVPAPRTLVSGVTKLPPATMQVIDADGQTDETMYWQPDYARSASRSDWSDQDWHDAIRQSLETAVQRSIVSKDHMGVLLSGGLDSSLLVALLANAGVEDIATFSVGFDGVGDQSGNEFVYSDRVAQEFGTDHHTLQIGTNELYAAVDDAIAAMTEPMASHDVPAFYLHSQAVAKHTNMVQCGQGADEIFAGYRYHRAADGVDRQEVLPTFLEAFEDHNQDDLAGILSPEWLAPSDVSREMLAEYLAEPGAQTSIDAVLRLETQLILADDPVKRVGNMSMAAGLEAFLPFLDHEFVELVITCPTELRTDQGGKGILKDIGRELLPNEVIDRPKGYFPVPALKHLQEPILSQVTDALQAPEAQKRGLFRQDFLDKLLAEPNDHYVPTGGNLLWQVGLLEMWLQRHGLG